MLPRRLAEACPDGTRERDGTCQTTLTLTPSKVEIAPARDHHTTHVFEVSGVPYLYVIGGTLSWRSIYGDVQRAKRSTRRFHRVVPAGRHVAEEASRAHDRAREGQDRARRFDARRSLRDHRRNNGRSGR